MYCFYLWTILQIIIESLPVSSSGHLALLEYLCPVGQAVKDSLLFYEPMQSYVSYIVHMPTAVVLCVYFYKEWSFPFRHIDRCFPLVVKISVYTALADIITVCCYAVKDHYGMFKMPLAVGFALTASSLYSLRWCTDKYASWTMRKAIILGCVQSVAFIPGISRFGLTYVAARWMGSAPRRAFQISMLIQWPLIILASCYSLYSLGSLSYELLNLPYILVMIGASIIAYKALCLVGHMVAQQSMWMWSVYMLIPVLISLCLSAY